MSAVRNLAQAPSVSTNPTNPYEALLLVSYGGPNGPEDVLPFMRNATRGKGIPDERLLEVSGHYARFGGVSPINECNARLVAALRAELKARGANLPVILGNRNWTPFISEAIDELETRGIHRVLMLPTSAYASYSGCRQYREDIAAALSPDTSIHVDKVRVFYDSPGFLQAQVDAVSASIRRLCERGANCQTLRLVLVTHSIPVAMQEGSGDPKRAGSDYVSQHRDLAAILVPRVEDALGYERGTIRAELAFCSRSGPPHARWLEPDINDRLEELADEGVTAVSCAPIGFVSDHMEVVFDLDTEAAETAAKLGLDYDRAASAGVHPALISSLVDLVFERAARARGEQVEQISTLHHGPWPDECGAHCCRMIAGFDSGIPVVAGPNAPKNGEAPTRHPHGGSQKTHTPPKEHS